MKAAQINRYGGSETVEINKDAAKPVISDGKLIVEVHAAGVNPFEWKVREGYMQQRRPLLFPANRWRARKELYPSPAPTF